MVNAKTQVMVWDFDRGEIIADGIVHAIGVALGVLGAVAMIVVAISSARGLTVACVLVYLLGLLAMLGFSAAYNLWPVSRAKWLLRRFDHSAIYLMIAGTYTPFIAYLPNAPASVLLLAGVWTVAVIGMLLKLLLPYRFDRLAIAIYVLLGWSGVIAYQPVVAALPSASLWLLLAGGVLYTAGVVFHVWESLRFQNAIWHGFVVLAAGCHYTAVLDCIMAASA
jgi:hemolysin III